MAEGGSRFAHFLQPIRDLSKVWKIEIADELERYIEEVAQLSILNPVDGVTKVNFAEAALLIQGSTAIYSRKVELLHQLVYQALDLLCSGKGMDGRGPKGKNAATGLWAPLPETDELITIDHLIKEGKSSNLTREENGSQREATQRRVPLFLMPRDQADRRKQEYRISSCSVHRTGALLIQESDARLLDDILGRPAGALAGELDQPLVSAPPHQEVHDLEARLREALQELPEDLGLIADTPADTGSALVASESRPVAGGTIEAKSMEYEGPEAKTPLPLSTRDDAKSGEQTASPGRSVEAAKAEAAKAVDPWALMDEHDASGKQNPLEVGNTEKRTSGKQLLAGVEAIPDLRPWEPLPDEELWGVNNNRVAAPMLAAGHPVESLFLAVAGRMQPGGRYETQRAGFSAAWLEMEDLIAGSIAARRSAKLKRKATTAAAGGAEGEAGPTPDGVDMPSLEEEAETEKEREAEAAELDAEAEEQAALEDKARKAGDLTPTKKGPEGMDEPGTPMRTPRKAGLDRSEEKNRFREQRKEVAMLESMIEDAQHTYEMTVRKHLQRMHKEAIDADTKKMPELYANVRRWQEQLEPVLKEYDQRTDFNIHSYSNQMLTRLKDLEARFSGNNGVVPFKSLVNGQPRWEVCRRFLTTLFLTNLGNTDIVVPTEEDKLNRFGVKLLIAEKKMIHLEGEEAQEPIPEKPSKAAKKNHKSPATCAVEVVAKSAEKCAVEVEVEEEAPAENTVKRRRTGKSAA